jgi:hypothetical protein
VDLDLLCFDENAKKWMKTNQPSYRRRTVALTPDDLPNEQLHGTGETGRRHSFSGNLVTNEDDHHHLAPLSQELLLLSSTSSSHHHPATALPLFLSLGGDHSLRTEIELVNRTNTAPATLPSPGPPAPPATVTATITRKPEF